MIYNGKLIKMTEYIRNTLVFLLKFEQLYSYTKNTFKRFNSEQSFLNFS